MTTPTPPTPSRPDAASAPAHAVDLALALDKFVPMELGQKHMDLRYAECVRLQDVLDMCKELDDRRAAPPRRRLDEGAVTAELAATIARVKDLTHRATSPFCVLVNDGGVEKQAGVSAVQMWMLCDAAERARPGAGE